MDESTRDWHSQLRQSLHPEQATTHGDSRLYEDEALVGTDRDANARQRPYPKDLPPGKRLVVTS